METLSTPQAWGIRLPRALTALPPSWAVCSPDPLQAKPPTIGDEGPVTGWMKQEVFLS